MAKIMWAGFCQSSYIGKVGNMNQSEHSAVSGLEWRRPVEKENIKVRGYHHKSILKIHH
jgi:hypothetical protein